MAWLYRLFAADLRDLLWKEPHLFMPDKHWRVAFKELHKEHPHMRPLVIHALSGESRSPLMSCTVDLKSAQKMIHMVGSSSHPKRLGPIVRMDPNKIGLDNIIDMSTQRAQNMFFHNALDSWGEYVRENSHVLSRSSITGQALVMWNGKVNIEHMEVVDNVQGDFILPYKDALAQIYFFKIQMGGVEKPSCLRQIMARLIGDEKAVEEYVRSLDIKGSTPRQQEQDIPRRTPILTENDDGGEGVALRPPPGLSLEDASGKAASSDASDTDSDGPGSPVKCSGEEDPVQELRDARAQKVREERRPIRSLRMYALPAPVSRVSLANIGWSRFNRGPALLEAIPESTGPVPAPAIECDRHGSNRRLSWGIVKIWNGPPVCPCGQISGHKAAPNLWTYMMRSE